MEETKTQVISVIDPQAITQVQKIMRDLWDQSQYEQYYHTFRDLEAAVERHHRELETQYPLIMQRYQMLMNTARWNCLNRVSIAEFETIFFQAIQGIAEKELSDVLECLRYALLQEPVREERDIWKQRLRDAISRSESFIGQTKIQVADSLVDPTVKNWIKDWKVFLGDREPTSLVLVEYFNSSPNIAQLPKETIDTVQKIFRLYIDLLKSSLTPEGAEEKFVIANIETGTLQLFDKGHFIESGIAMDKDELTRMRANVGLDASGRSLPVSQLFHRTQDFKAYARQVLAREGVDIQQEQGGAQPQKRVIRNEEIAQNFPAAVAPLTVAPAELVVEKPVVAPAPVVPPQSPRTLGAPAAWKTVPTSLPTAEPSEQTPKAAAPRPLPVAPRPISRPQPQSTVFTKPKQELTSRELAQFVLSDTSLLLPSSETEQRFVSVCTQYFDQALTLDEFREELVKVTEMGGIGLLMVDAQRVLVVAQRLQKSDFSIPQVSVPMPKPHVKAPSLETLQKAMVAPASKKPKAATNVEPMVEDIFGNMDSAQVSGAQAWKPVTDSMPSAMKRGPVPVRSNDMPTLMGPLDELRSMTIQEFRRLSPQPHEAARHIANQLAVLEEESMAQKAAGIAAWGQSPLNQMYLSIGRESLDRMMSIDDIIQSHLEKKETTLTIAEFQAIADFNRTLRF